MNKENNIFQAAYNVLTEKIGGKGIKTVGQLIAELNQFDPKTNISGEETTLNKPTQISVRTAGNNLVIISVGARGQYYN